MGRKSWIHQYGGVSLTMISLKVAQDVSSQSLGPRRCSDQSIQGCPVCSALSYQKIHSCSAGQKAAFEEQLCLVTET
jgi:hypothetical protein